MSKVQTDNTRRIVFTAMALVVLWVASWHAYLLGVEVAETRHAMMLATNFLYPVYPMPEFVSPVDHVAFHWFLASPCLALGPTLLMSVSTGAFFRLPGRWTIGYAIVFFGVIALVFLAGEDRWFRSREPLGQPLELSVPDEGPSVPWIRPSLANDPWWLWLLLPIILTTAFVIYGAWRSAVKTAAVEAEMDDE